MTPLPEKAFDRLDYSYKLLMIIALVIVAIVLASDIIIPMAFAAILSVVMLPVVRRLERLGLGTALSITLVLLVTVALLAVSVWLIVNQVVGLVNDLPNLQTKFQAYIDRVSLMLRQDFGVSIQDQNKYLTDAMRTGSAYAGAILLTTTNTLSTVVQVPIYIFLFLIYRNKFQAFIEQLLPGRDELGWKEDMQRVLQGYISGLFLVTLIIATLNSIGLMIVGIDHAIFFGVLSGVLTIIPYVGIIIGSLLPIVMALITKDSAWSAIGVVIVFTIVQFLEGNFITPRITGSKVSINALAAIIALLIGGKLLGIAGMILAVPGIGLLKIVLSHSRHLKAFVILLEDDNNGKTPLTSDKDELAPPPPDAPTISQ